MGIKASSQKEVIAVRRAIGEMLKRNLLGPTPIELVLGPERLLFGEEKALLKVIEGGDPVREKQIILHTLRVCSSPTPAAPSPMVVNNVETLSNIPHIVRRGAAWIRTIIMLESCGEAQ